MVRLHGIGLGTTPYSELPPLDDAGELLDVVEEVSAFPLFAVLSAAFDSLLSALPGAVVSPSVLAPGLASDLFLKSVTYQPVPLSRNPAADTSFCNVAVLQTGQMVSGGSEIFFKTSSRLPQLVH
jgi:hypothetical protein